MKLLPSSSMAPITISPIDKACDWDEVFASLWTAWSHPPQPIAQLVFPYLGEGGSKREQESFEVCKARWRAEITDDPKDMWAKAVDQATGKIVGGLLGKVYEAEAVESKTGRSEGENDEKKVDLQTTAWMGGTEMRMLAEAIFGEINRMREQLATGRYGGDLISLLAVATPCDKHTGSPQRPRSYESCWTA